MLTVWLTFVFSGTPSYLVIKQLFQCDNDNKIIVIMVLT